MSSKTHWDVPITIGCQTLHLLCTHPQSPVYDGAEDHNGRRNNDEIRFWVDYLSGGSGAGYIVDDRGQKGPLAQDASFVLLGDLNADPLQSMIDKGTHSIVTLLKHSRVLDPAPTSPAPSRATPRVPRPGSSGARTKSHESTTPCRRRISRL